MDWNLSVPKGTKAVDVMHALRKGHAEAAALEDKGLAPDVEDQMNAAIRAVDGLWREVAKEDANGQPTGELVVSLSGSANPGHKADSITVEISQA